MNASSLYVAASQVVFKMDFEENKTESIHLLNEKIPQLRSVLSCAVCQAIVNDPYVPCNRECDHNVCRQCIKGSKALQPPCPNCNDAKDFRTYDENRQLSKLVECFKNLCEHLSTADYFSKLSKVPIKQEPDEIPSLLIWDMSVQDIVLEGAKADEFAAFTTDISSNTTMESLLHASTSVRSRFKEYKKTIFPDMEQSDSDEEEEKPQTSSLALATAAATTTTTVMQNGEATIEPKVENNEIEPETITSTCASTPIQIPELESEQPTPMQNHVTQEVTPTPIINSIRVTDLSRLTNSYSNHESNNIDYSRTNGYHVEPMQNGYAEEASQSLSHAYPSTSVSQENYTNSDNYPNRGIYENHINYENHMPYMNHENHMNHVNNENHINYDDYDTEEDFDDFEDDGFFGNHMNGLPRHHIAAGIYENLNINREPTINNENRINPDIFDDPENTENVEPTPYEQTNGFAADSEDSNSPRSN